MIIAGTVVGSAGTLLTQLMAKAMNRSLGNVLFSGFGDTGAAATGEVSGSLKPIEASDAGVMMAFAQKVIVVPGYGMAVAQAQHKSGSCLSCSSSAACSCGSRSIRSRDACPAT